MAGWNDRNCCCEPKLYGCAAGEVAICCLTLTVSTWTQVLSLYAVGYDPDDICGYVSSSYHNNNHCGYVLRGLCGFPSAEIRWGIQSDGTVKMEVNLGSTTDENGDFVPPVSHTITGLDPENWFASPVVFTLSGVTYTIEVCPDPHAPFPGWPLSAVYLKAAATALTHETRSLGTTLCGGPCNPFGSFLNFVFLSWTYNVYSDEITISFGGSVGSGSITIPYDSGNWADDTHTIPVSAYIGPDFSVTVTASDSCDIPPPPTPCENENACWPDLCPCLVYGKTGEIYRTIYADVSGSVTATGLALLPDNPNGKFTYSSGADFINIICQNGGLDPYTVTATISGNILLLVTIPAGGLACSEDGLQMVDETVTDGFMTIRFYTI